MNMEKILNIWGKGQILTLSALDGQTSSRHGLVFTTAEKEFALLPRWPFNSGKIAFAGAPENLFLASDMLESSGVKAAFVDAFHFLIEAENVSLDLPPELAVLHEGKRILIGTKANFNPELIRIDLDSILAERKRYFEELPDFSSTDTARRTLAKAYSQLKGQICSPEGFNALHRWTTPRPLAAPPRMALGQRLPCAGTPSHRSRTRTRNARSGPRPPAAGRTHSAHDGRRLRFTLHSASGSCFRHLGSSENEK